MESSDKRLKTHAFRLTHGMDLKKEIEKYCKAQNIIAGSVLSGVGCVYRACIRNAGGIETIEVNKDLEIVSLMGTISKDGLHLHISLSDENLKTIGGHLKAGCLVNTTAEIILVELEEYEFTRKMDETTGYKELNVKKINY